MMELNLTREKENGWYGPRRKRVHTLYSKNNLKASDKEGLLTVPRALRRCPKCFCFNVIRFQCRVHKYRGMDGA